MRPPILIAHHRKSGVAALNVISAALGADPRTAGIPVRFPPRREALAEVILEAASAGMTPVAAWSFYSTDFDEAALDLAWVRERTRDTGVIHIAGGVHATAEPKQTLDAGFDLCAIGEGETTVVTFFTALLDGADYRAIRGVAHLDGAGALVSHGPAERKPLDAYPAFDVRHRKFNAIEITRGCVYACSFCQTPFMFKARFRHRSIADIEAHAKALNDADLAYARFVTPTALSYGSDDETVNLPAVEAMLAAVRGAMGKERRVYFGTFPSEMRPEHVSAEALAMLRRWVDNDNLVIGAQSGSDRVLQSMRRGHGVAEVERAVRLCVEAGFLPNVDFLWGLPDETPDDRRLSLALAERLVAMGARIHGHAFMPLPGTPLGDAQPTTIEPEAALEMARLESRGAMYGQWRKQVVAAENLARRRALR